MPRIQQQRQENAQWIFLFNLGLCAVFLRIIIFLHISGFPGEQNKQMGKELSFYPSRYIW